MVTIPPRPVPGAVFNPPPTWPAAPQGWVPPAGFTPDPSWGPVPEGWQFWLLPVGAGAGAAPVRQRSWFARHKVLTALAALLLLGLLGGMLGGGGKEEADVAPAPATSTTAAAATQPASTAPGSTAPAPASTSQAAATSKAAAQLAKVGETVKEDKAELTVTAFTCGQTHVGGAYGKDAQGQYCIANVQVKNAGDKPLSWFASNQKLHNAAGQTFETSDDAIFLEQEAHVYEEINPGNSVAAILLFDVPKDMTPTQLELHASMFSRGVKVAVG